MSLEVLSLTEATVAAWDSYVDKAESATFFHRAGWKEVQELAFGHATHFLYAQEEGQVVGVLPLVHIKSALFGNSLSSTPFCVYGGIVADSPAAEDALREAACNLAVEKKVGSLELRNRSETSTNWPVKDLYFTFRKEIDPDDDVNLKAIPNRQRAMVRKGIKEGLESEWDSSTDRVFGVYSESVRNLGTPIFSSKYLRILKDVFADDCSMLMITHEGQDVAGVMSFYFRNEVIPYYGGSTSAARNIKGVNHFMYWELMRRSREQGYTLFDFGRSKAGTGAYSFKKNFGFVPEPLPYEYFLVRDKSVPEVNPLNPKYQLMIKVWTRLPLPVANTLGPFLARSLG
jgi:FemAB-related protein (PEP-CTERM system-associated)